MAGKWNFYLIENPINRSHEKLPLRKRGYLFYYPSCLCMFIQQRKTSTISRGGQFAGMTVDIFPTKGQYAGISVKTPQTKGVNCPERGVN